MAEMAGDMASQAQALADVQVVESMLFAQVLCSPVRPAGGSIAEASFTALPCPAQRGAGLLPGAHSLCLTSPHQPCLTITCSDGASGWCMGGIQGRQQGLPWAGGQSTSRTGHCLQARRRAAEAEVVVARQIQQGWRLRRGAQLGCKTTLQGQGERS